VRFAQAQLTLGAATDAHDVGIRLEAPTSVAAAQYFDSDA
jgi:hypothetical protein